MTQKIQNKIKNILTLKEKIHTFKQKIKIKKISSLFNSTLKLNKSAKFTVEPLEDWPEIIAFVFLVIGFILAITTEVWMNYALIGLGGLAFGKTFSNYNKHWPLTTIIIVLGFLAGFLLGAFRTNRQLIVFIFIFSLTLSYFINKKKYLKSV